MDERDAQMDLCTDECDTQMNGMRLNDCRNQKIRKSEYCLKTLE